MASGMRALNDYGNSERVNKSFGTNGNDYERMDSDDSDSDESFTCEYDSTWEDEVDKGVAIKTHTKENKPMWRSWSDRRNTYAARDMQIYRRDYPDEVDPPPCQIFTHPNLKFYRNESESQPDGVSVVDFHEKWWGNYQRLEKVHTYIQWLFPLRENGVNFQAYKLTKDEIKAFKADELAKEKLKKSYELMLDFYGIKLVDHKTGKVQRAANWEKRFENLNKYTHNNLRITRILKCLGTLGFTHYQAPLVRFFLQETLKNGQLQNVRTSVLDYFLFSVLDKEQRKELIKEAFFMLQKSQGDGKSREKFVWCPKWVQNRFQEELNSKKLETNRTNQNLVSVDETQSSIERDTTEQNNQLEKEGGSSEDIEAQKYNRADNQEANKEPNSSATMVNESLGSKLSDEKEASIIHNGEENSITRLLGDGGEVQNDINDQQQGQCANKPPVTATNTISDSRCSIKPADADFHTAMPDEAADLTTVSQDKSKYSPEKGNKEVKTGVPAECNKNEKLKQDSDKDVKEKLDLPTENLQSGDGQCATCVDHTAVREGSHTQCSTVCPDNLMDSQQIPPENQEGELASPGENTRL